MRGGRAKSPLWEGWGPGFLSAADRAKSPLWEGWEGPGFLSAADRAKSPLLELGGARFPIRRG